MANLRFAITHVNCTKLPSVYSANCKSTSKVSPSSSSSSLLFLDDRQRVVNSIFRDVDIFQGDFFSLGHFFIAIFLNTSGQDNLQSDTLLRLLGNDASIDGTAIVWICDVNIDFTSGIGTPRQDSRDRGVICLNLRSSVPVPSGLAFQRQYFNRKRSNEFSFTGIGSLNNSHVLVVIAGEAVPSFFVVG